MSATEEQIAAQCPNGHVFRVKAKAEGRKVRCPKCKVPVLILRDTNALAINDPTNGMDELASAEIPVVENGFFGDLPENNGPPDLPPFDMPADPPSSPCVTTAVYATNLPQSSTTPVHPTTSTTQLKPVLTKNHIQAVILLLALLLAAQVFGFSKTKNASTKWEYTLESPSDTSFESSLERMGNQGWELVTARRATSTYGGASYEMIFKRPK
ncbi:hypothetical protein [Novipirellula sp.]|uniref:hypothetical protein n=1 Tax=Novipirellula sp. TaxID=2795430 RepID=UPI00356AA1D0